MATATSVTQAQQLQLLYQEDEAQLLLYLNAMKASLQDAMKDKQKVAEHHESTRQDWSKKLKARHKEVSTNSRNVMPGMYILIDELWASKGSQLRIVHKMPISSRIFDRSTWEMPCSHAFSGVNASTLFETVLEETRNAFQFFMPEETLPC